MNPFTKTVVEAIESLGLRVSVDSHQDLDIVISSSRRYRDRTVSAIVSKDRGYVDIRLHEDTRGGCQSRMLESQNVTLDEAVKLIEGLTGMNPIDFTFKQGE